MKKEYLKLQNKYVKSLILFAVLTFLFILYWLLPENIVRYEILILMPLVFLCYGSCGYYWFSKEILLPHLIFVAAIILPGLFLRMGNYNMFIKETVFLLCCVEISVLASLIAKMTDMISTKRMFAENPDLISEREKDKVNNTQGYVVLSLFSVFLFLGLIGAIDGDYMTNPLHFLWNMIYVVLVLPVGSILYGAFSYKLTSRILLPNLLFYGISFFVLMGVVCIYEYFIREKWEFSGFDWNNVLDSLRFALIWIAISLVCSVITMLAKKVSERRKNRRNLDKSLDISAK